MKMDRYKKGKGDCGTAWCREKKSTMKCIGIKRRKNGRDYLGGMIFFTHKICVVEGKMGIMNWNDCIVNLANIQIIIDKMQKQKQ